MKKYTIGIDLGGTFVKLGLLHEGNLVTSTKVKAVSAIGLAAQLPSLKEAIDGHLLDSQISTEELAGIGFAFSGLVNSKTNRIISTNKKYDDGPSIDLAGWAMQNWRCPLFAENDARAALLGEWAYGAARGYDDVVMVTIGTGIGMGVLMEGKLVRGKHFQGGNIGGHFCINFQGTTCTCGNKGCIESEASTWRLPSLLRGHPDFGNSEMKDLDVLDFKTLFDCYRKGVKVAQEVLEHCLSAWAAGIVTMIHAYDPEMVVISGGVMESADIILPYIQKYVDEYAWTPWGRVKVIEAEYPDTAALLGCDCLVRRALGANQ